MTGASSGIGFGVAQALADDQYRVVATARREEKLVQLGLPAEDIIAGDLQLPEFQDELERYIFKTYGRCDLLVNNAGTLYTAPIGEMDVDRMASMIRLNVEATFRLTYAFLKQFKRQGFGHVINLSSILGTKVRPTAGAYAATKYAIEALSEALRMELAGTGIGISCIEPGLVMTELHNDWDVHPKESMGIHEPLQVDDIVRAVRYILSQPEHVRVPRLMILPGDHNI